MTGELTSVGSGGGNSGGDGDGDCAGGILMVVMAEIVVVVV